MREADYLPLIETGLREDLGELGDVTSLAVVPDEACAASLVSKDGGILAGEEVFAAVFRTVDPSVRTVFRLHDGAPLSPGDVVAEISGLARSILCAERTAINFIAFLSGIATATHRFVSLASAGGHAVILDTRKTMPGYRALSKYAVTVGGGRNHRMGLHDMVVVKDNHIDSAGSIRTAVDRVRRRWGGRFTVEVECRSRREVEEALEAGADIVMLDNMGVDEVREAVDLVGGRSKLEASGNMTEEKIAAVSAAGVDFISVGKLTHSVRAFDFSLKVKKGK
jgi:nicotinate-nucleotide pyrophosphorylase (carboxylating)